jgi:uncharacterized glyoxalase superfamily protein PhnB
MTTVATSARAPIIPCLTYRDAHRAIDWLCATFGFEKLAVHEADDGSIAHADLSFGSGIVMLSSVKKDTEFGRWLLQPDEAAGRGTQTIYVVTEHVDEIHRRVQSSGAEILMKLEEKDYGGSGFSCRDLEGHIWSFGTFDPWTIQR